MITGTATGAGAEESVSEILIDQAERLFSSHISPSVLEQAELSGWAQDLWNAVEESGFMLSLVEEQAGGFGLCAQDAFRLIRLSGYHNAPIPFGEMLVASALWTRSGGVLPPGITTLAPGDPFKADMRELENVPWGARSDNVLIEVEQADGSRSLALIPATTVAEGRNLAQEPRDGLQLGGNPRAEEHGLRIADEFPSIHSCGALVRACQMVGAMERALDLAISHASERRQFGREISKFQVIQHMLADMAGEFASAAAAVDGAVDLWGKADFTIAAAVAKARAGEVAGKIAAAAHQIHGALGFTRDHPLHYSTRRLWSWREEFGSDAFWEDFLGRRICEAGGQAVWERLIAIAHPLDRADA